MKPYKTRPIPSSEITPRELFHARRKFIQLAGGVSMALRYYRVFLGRRQVWS